MVAAKVCPGGGATLSSRTRPVTTGTLCGSSRQSRLAGSMTSGTPHSLCWQGLRCLSVVLVLGCIAVCVGVRRRLFGQGLCLSLRGSGARVYCCARWCTDTSIWARLCLSLRGFGARVYCRARLCADTSMWARIVLVPPWFWCSCSLPCALVYEYCLWARFALVSCGPGALRVGVRIRPMGKDCAFCPWSLCSARVARIGARIWLRGQGLRVFLRGPGAQRELRVLVCGYGL